MTTNDLFVAFGEYFKKKIWIHSIFVFLSYFSVKQKSISLSCIMLPQNKKAYTFW